MIDEEPRNITKRELVNRIAERLGLTKVTVRDVTQHFLAEIINELSQGNRLEFRDFGVFEVRERAARIAQNPRTLEKVPVPAKRVVKFKVGRVMRQRVCENDETATSSSFDVAPAGGERASAGRAPAKGGPKNGSNAGKGEAVEPAARVDEPKGETKPQPPQRPQPRPGSPF